jgi:hypothetical protein
VQINGRLVLVGDGIKAPKRGKKMPAVKLLHQQSAILILPAALAGTHHGRALNVESSPLWKRISPSSDPSF